MLFNIFSVSHGQFDLSLYSRNANKILHSLTAELYLEMLTIGLSLLNIIKCTHTNTGAAAHHTPKLPEILSINPRIN